MNADLLEPLASFADQDRLVALLLHDQGRGHEGLALRALTELIDLHRQAVRDLLPQVVESRLPNQLSDDLSFAGLRDLILRVEGLPEGQPAESRREQLGYTLARGGADLQHRRLRQEAAGLPANL